MRKLTPIEKAQRLVEKAKQVLIEKGEYDSELEGYQNRRAVRTAGRLLWRAEEVMINAVFNVKNEQCTDPYIEDYVKAIAPHDRRLASLVEADYGYLWGFMGDIGIQDKSLCDYGFKYANKMISLLSKMLPKQPNNASLSARRAKLLSHPSHLTPTQTQLTLINPNYHHSNNPKTINP